VSDPSEYLGIISKIIDAFERFMAQRREQKEQKAALILKAANVLNHSLKELGNAYKRPLVEAMCFSPNTSSETRERVRNDLKKFVYEEYIVPYIRTSVHELTQEDTLANVDPKNCTEIVSSLARRGKNVIDLAEGMSDIMSYFDDIEFFDILSLIDNARTPDELQRLKDMAYSKLGSFDFTTIRIAHAEFGQLKSCIGHRYGAASTIADI
jgi:hypothetical protein